MQRVSARRLSVISLRFILMMGALFALTFLAGCAEKGPILLDIAYQAPAEKAGNPPLRTVVLSPLRDDRGKPEAVIGKRSVPSGLVNDLVVKGTVAKLATTALREALERRSITVKEGADWDLTAEGMRADYGAIHLGGEIKDLWITSVSVPFKTTLTASVRIRIVAGDDAEGKIVRTLDVSSKIEEQILYSREQLEAALSETMTAAIDQIFKDEELKKRLQ